MQAYRSTHAIRDTWPTTERMLVCVSPCPLSVWLVRATRRMAARLRAQWLAVYVEAPASLRPGRSQAIAGFVVLAQIEPHLLLLRRDTEPHRRVESLEEEEGDHRRKHPGGHNGDQLYPQGTHIA